MAVLSWNQIAEKLRQPADMQERLDVSAIAFFLFMIILIYQGASFVYSPLSFAADYFFLMQLFAGALFFLTIFYEEIMLICYSVLAGFSIFVFCVLPLEFSIVARLSIGVFAVTFLASCLFYMARFFIVLKQEREKRACFALMLVFFGVPVAFYLHHPAL